MKKGDITEIKRTLNADEILDKQLKYEIDKIEELICKAMRKFNHRRKR